MCGRREVISVDHMLEEIKVLAFDTFGTVTDWHTGVSRTLSEIFPEIDSSMLANQWRAAYSPALAEVESGSRPWTLLDDLHRETLDTLVRQHGCNPSGEQLDVAVQAWHVLPGWPDSVPALTRMKSGYVISTMSNGNVAMLTHMAKNAGFPWDVVAGADLWRHYKPARETYLGLAELLQVEPHEMLMVATHASDLDAARSFGLHTAYVERPSEYGPQSKHEAINSQDLFHARDLNDLATQLGC